MTSKDQHIELDNALVAPENYRVIGKCNMRINPGMKPKEPTYHVALDALALTTCYLAFLIIFEVSVTVTKHKSSYRFKINNKKFYMNVEVFRDILNLCPRIHERSSTLLLLLLIIYTNHGEPLHQSSTNVSVERMFMHTAKDDSLLSTMRFIPRNAETQVYGAILLEAMMNQALLNFVAYKTYYVIASGAEPPKSRKSQKKSDSNISS
ncbi:hypothetical protein Tco_0298300, partial [Tanacetum coccineum]